MRIRLCILSCNPELMHECVETALAHATGPIDVFGFYNGGSGDVDVTYDRFRDLPKVQTLSIGSWAENRGVPAGLHELYKAAKVLSAPTSGDESFGGSSGTVLWQYHRLGGPVEASQDILVHVHDDVNVVEHGWDQRVARAFTDFPKVGMVSFGGSTALGGNEIYKVPYEIHQLGRRDFYSNMNGAEVHGVRTTQDRPIVSTDGMSIVLRRSLLDKIQGWSWIPPHIVHHAYDYAISCMNRRHGFEARLVPVAIHHKGGLTAGTDVHKNMAAKYGGDTAVHAAAHRWVYDNFRDCYPLRLR